MPGYQVVKRAQLVAVADKNLQRAEWLAKRFGVKDVYADPQEITERDDNDAVDICLPGYLHKQFIIAAADAGKHVFCEKPMAISVAEANEIVDKVNSSNIHLMVGFNQRFARPFIKMKEIIDKGLLGSLLSIEITYARCGSSERYLPPSWRADPAKGGGALLDLACHKIDLLRWFAGEVKGISAMKSHYLGAEAEDMGVVILTFQSGALGLLSTSLVCSSPYNELDFTHIYGSKGTTRVSSELKQAIQVYVKGALVGRTSNFVTLNLSSKKSTYTLELEAFFEAILNHQEPPITAQDARNVLQVVEAARESARTGKTIFF
jgi:predicted dehydrogenase